MGLGRGQNEGSQGCGARCAAGSRVVGPPSDDEPIGSGGRAVANRVASQKVRRELTERAEPSRATIVLNLSTGGLGILAVLGAVLVAKSPPWTLSSSDAVFWGAVVALAVVRFVELRRVEGSREAPDVRMAGSTWRKFALVLGALATVIWFAAQAVQGGRS
jgi:hypothetical protein